MEFKTVISVEEISIIGENENILASLKYQELETEIIVNSINVDESLRGQGIAGKLMEEIYSLAQQKSKKITPVCSYAAKWMDKVNL